jgi:DNA mismatch repair protein MutS2
MCAAISERTLEDLGWPKLLGALAGRAVTTLGVERALALPFLSDKGAALRSFGLIEEVRLLLREELPIPLGAVEDVGTLLLRASKGAILSATEVLACGRLIRSASDVQKFLKSVSLQAPGLSGYSEGLPALAPLASRIQRTIEPNGLIRDDASYELQLYREQVRSLHRKMKRKIESYLQDTQMEDVLQDDFYSVRGERYVLPVRSSDRSRVPGIIHNASNSGQTVFVEPQALVPLGNDLTIAQSCVDEEEEKVLAEFSADIGVKAPELDAALRTLAELDLIQASARLSDDLDAHVPSLVKLGRGRGDAESTIGLKSLRHPLLVLQGEEVVQNAVGLGPGERALVISGPNAGGKTVTMTAVGLAGLMIRSGLPIPAAEGSYFPWLAGITSAVGDAQDMEQHLSTFSAHLAYLKGALSEACDGWLVMVDEIAADTDPVEGAALAQAVVEALVAQGALVVLTTHLEAIKALGITDPRFVNARVGLDPKTGHPTYRLEANVAGVSNALDVAERMGLPASVIARSRENLSGSGALTLALQTLEGQARDNALLNEGLERDRKKLRDARAELEQLQSELVQQKAAVELQVRRELSEELHEVQKQARAVAAQLREGATLKEAEARQREMLQARKQLESEVEDLGNALERERSDELKPVPTELKVGMTVVLAKLKREACIVAVEGSRVQVAMGSLKMMVKPGDIMALKSPEAVEAVVKTPKRAREAIVEGRVNEPDVRCDVRGLRGEEALGELEQFLDRSYQKGMGTVLVHHGHGTGALKRAIREHLEISPYVRGFRPGESHEGGDGVTVIKVDC